MRRTYLAYSRTHQSFTIKSSATAARQPPNILQAMSVLVSPPTQHSYAANIDESKLPRGQCRYILLNPEIKGQRCACICFTLNHDHPGVVCQCGHQSCYHIKDRELTHQENEVERLRQRVNALEKQLDRDSHGELGGDLGLIIKRLSELEDTVERNKEEAVTDIKGCYRNVSRTWQSIDQVAKRQKLQETFLDERLDDHADSLARLDGRLDDLNDFSISTVERLEFLEEAEPSISATSSRSSPPSKTISSEQSPDATSSTASRLMSERDDKITTNTSAFADMAEGLTTLTSDWTVHVSLLPSISQPFPFEKDTQAYKRCLSRGLHQMIAVNGRDSAAFISAVASAFGYLLKGREWAPLHARLCDKQPLAGLPMLRPLEPSLLAKEAYTHDFLSANCAVLTADGRIDSLYIAMRNENLTWDQLLAAPVCLKGLESSWKHDPRLDPPVSPSRHLSSSASTHHMAPPASKKRLAKDISRGSETLIRLSGGLAVRGATPAPSTVTETRPPTTTEKAESDDFGRAAKIPRTTCDVPVSLNLRPHGEATAIA